MSRVFHEFGAFYDEKSEILILGSFPSVKSRAESFYYAHPQNRFWRVLAASLGCDVPCTISEKKAMLTAHRIALWDVIESCEISGSSDASIKNATPTDIGSLLNKTQVSRVICNGQTAGRYFRRYYPEFPLPTVTLPSTSPANASWTLDALICAWQAEISRK